MAYAYCDGCRNALSSPTIEEAAAGRQLCGCGEERPLREDEVESTFQQFRERFEAMEEVVARLTPPEPLKPEEDPIGFASEKLIASMTGRVQALAKEKARREKYLRHVSVDDAEQLQDTTSEIEAISRKISQLQTKIGVLQTTPKDAFLPLGTVVEFTGYPERSVYGYPAPGTIGVVTQLETKGEYFLGVSVAKDFVDRFNTEINPTYSSFPTYMADPGMLKVISYGRLPGGAECKYFGFTPTHKRKDEDENEMIVFADDRYWRFHNFDDRGVEALQAYETFAGMTWLEADTFDPEEPSSGPKL